METASIFVSIPAYRDPECQYTIIDLFQKAVHPERIFVGVCWQAHGSGETAFGAGGPEGGPAMFPLITPRHAFVKPLAR